MVDVSVKINLKNVAAGSDLKKFDAEPHNKRKKEQKDSPTKKMELSDIEIAEEGEIVETSKNHDGISTSKGKEEEDKKKCNDSKDNLRDVGSDLDDLLNKISTIVDCADAEKKTDNKKENSLSKKPLNGDKTSNAKLSTDSNAINSAQSDIEDIFEDASDTIPPSIEAISSQTSYVDNKYDDINDEFADLEAELEALDNIRGCNDAIQIMEEEEYDDSDILLLDLEKHDESNENKKENTQKTKTETNIKSSEPMESSTDQNKVEDNIDNDIIIIPEDEESNSKIDKVDNEESLSITASESSKMENLKKNPEENPSQNETEFETLEMEKTKPIESSKENGITKANVDNDADNNEEGEVEEEVEEEIPKKSTKNLPKVNDDDDDCGLVDLEEKDPTMPEDIAMESLVVHSDDDEATPDNLINEVSKEETTISTEEKLDTKNNDDDIMEYEVEEASLQAGEDINDEDSKENNKPSDMLMGDDVIDDHVLDDKLEEIPTAIEAPILGETPDKIDIVVGDVPTTSNSNEAIGLDSDDDVMVINDDDNDGNNKEVLKDTAEAEVDMEVESTEVEQNTEITSDNLNPTKSNSSDKQESNDVTTEILAVPAVINDVYGDITEVIDECNALCNDPKTSISDKSKENDQEPTPTVNQSQEVDESNDILIIEDDDDDELITKADVSQKSVENDEGKETSSDEKATLDYIASKSGQEEESEPTTTTKSTNGHEKATDESVMMIVDNSDNACDQFEKRKDASGLEKTTDETETEEINSNSSSNLLRPRKRMAPEEEEDRCSESADVELIDIAGDGDGEGDTQEDKEPLTKRLRLSVDSELLPGESDATQKMETDDTSVSLDNNINDKEVSSSNNLKRAHCSIDVDNDDDDEDTKESTTKREEEGIEKELKKTKLEKTISPTKNDELKKIGDDTQDTITKVESKPPISNEIDLSEGDDTGIPPVKLYPEPKFSEKSESIRLEYVRRFKKSFDKMTRNDLEELILLKVVESLQFKSEFAELKMQINHQENSLKAYRTRVAELKKRFVDLEGIHNNLKKEVQEHNSKYIMPTKVTRSVALNVNLSSKRLLEASITSGCSTIVPSTPAAQPATTSASGQRPVQRGNPPLTSNMQRTTTQPMIATKRTSEPPIMSTSNQLPHFRRGCVQKVTPQRPMPHVLNTASNNVGSRNTVTAAHTSSQLKSPPKLLNKCAPLRSQPTAVTSAVAAAALSSSARGRPSLPIQSSDYQQDINKQRTLGSKPVAKLSSMRRSDVSCTIPTTVVNLASSAFGNGSIATTPNLTSAKPKEKAVIDLTDEDETAEAAWRQQQATQAQNRSAQISMPAQGIVPARQRPLPPSGAVIRRTPSCTAPRLPIPQRPQQPTGAARQPPQNAVQRAPNNVNLPPGTNISRVIPAPPSPRRHPAPLPETPLQQYNLAWKLPPPRPVIRISLMENGIVISWTVEDPGEKHADCASYQIYAYQETRQTPSTDLWRHVGDVKAMLLPMAVTLNQFQENQRYFFAVRAVDEFKRYGPFSLPKTWTPAI